MDKMLIHYQVRTCSPKDFPIFNYTVSFREGENVCEYIYDKACNCNWECSDVMIYSFEERKPLPDSLHVNWISFYEKKQYSIDTKIPAEDIFAYFSSVDKNGEDRIFDFLIVGMTPDGHFALWIAGNKKSKLLLWQKAEEMDVDLCVFFPNCSNLTFSQLIKEFGISNSIAYKNFFHKYMQQFTYRYLLLFERWDADDEVWQNENGEVTPVFNLIEETLFDGTHDKLHDGGLMNYHQAGKPKKLAVKWHIKKSEYTAYFWFEDEEIRETFDRFYGAHPDTKTDFMIRIDSEKNKYELALYRYGLKEPQVISESAYQLLVFKNKFEYYRSENYNQPRGAWIW